MDEKIIADLFEKIYADSALSEKINAYTASILSKSIREDVIINNEIRNFIGEKASNIFFKLGELEEKITPELKNIDVLGDEIIKSYKESRLVLVLGAGVSMDYGLPSWSRLLQKLIVRTLDNQYKENQVRNQIASKLFDLVFGPSPLISARYLSNHYREMNKKNKLAETFEEAIRDSLYDGLEEKKDSELFRELVKICVSAGKKHKIDSVITYNYDDLLEFHLKDLNLDFPFKSVFSTGQNPNTEELPIYHVHGFLPRTVKLDKGHNVTLSDDNYHSQYTDIYRWSNMIQLNKFKDFNCLFIGNSLTDPNQRRLLDIAKEQRGNSDIQHFVIKRKYKVEKVETLVENILKIHNNILDGIEMEKLVLMKIAKFLVDTVHDYENKDAISFGAEIIWVEEFEEIPNVLKRIREEIKK